MTTITALAIIVGIPYLLYKRWQATGEKIRQLGRWEGWYKD